VAQTALQPGAGAKPISFIGLLDALHRPSLRRRRSASLETQKI